MLGNPKPITASVRQRLFPSRGLPGAKRGGPKTGETLAIPRFQLHLSGVLYALHVRAQGLRVYIVHQGCERS